MEEIAHQHHDVLSSDEDEIVGGILQEPALCLLDGFEDDTRKRFRIPIRRLPATLGRYHETDNPNFVSLGMAKAISREHVRLDYGIQGGYLESSATADGDFTFREDPSYSHLPKTGAFVLELLGKNRIVVDRKRIEQGQMVILDNATEQHAIKIGPLALYFFPPSEANSSNNNNKKRWSIDVSSAKPTAIPTHLFDKMTWEELWEAHETAKTDRRQQIVGAAMAVQAVRAAAKGLGKKDVLRIDLTDWMSQHAPYAEFQKGLMERMEHKSFQACITKALLRSGFVRNSGAGRFIKWKVPPEVLGDGEEEEMSGEEGQKEDEDEEMEEESEQEDDDDEELVREETSSSIPSFGMT